MTFKYYNILFLIFLEFAFDDNCLLKYEVSNDIIYLEPGNKRLTIKSKIINRSTKNVVLYNFQGEIIMPPFEEKELCGEKVAASRMIFVYDEEMNQIFPGNFVLIPDSLDYSPMPKERVIDIIDISRRKFIASSIILEANQSIANLINIDLNDYDIRKGIYYVQLAYASGKYVSNFVTDIDVEDNLKNNREVFNGCVRANRVKVVVK